MASAPPAVILVRPSEEGNIGSVARAMANTGLSRLIVVEPAAAVGATARAFAVGAQHILAEAVRAPSFDAAVASFQRLAGTSSHRQRQPRTETVTPRELPPLLTPAGLATALVFGPERSGLTTDELARCHVLVRIPAAPEQPTLNLAQAVLILSYELMMAAEPRASRTSGPPVAAASLAEVEGLLGHLRTVLRRIGFARDDTFASVFRDLRRLALRARLSPREVQILRGLLRRNEHALRSAAPRRR